MIEGVKIDVTSEEMKKALDGRVAYHRKRASWYEEQAGALRKKIGETVQKIQDEADPENEELATNISLAYGKGSFTHQEDPLTALATKAKGHRSRQAFFAFLAEHVIPNETYRLKEEDLLRLELTSRYL